MAVIPDEKKQRVAHLKAQGWTTKDVSRDTGVLANTIDASWRSWAAQFGIDIPSPGVRKPINPPSEVTSYRIDAKTGERLTEPITEVVDLPTDSMPGDGASTISMRERIEQDVELKQARKSISSRGFKLVAEEPAFDAVGGSGGADEYPGDKKFCGAFSKATVPPYFNLIDSLNRLMRRYITTNQLLPDDYCYNMELADGVLSISVTLPIKKENR